MPPQPTSENFNQRLHRYRLLLDAIIRRLFVDPKWFKYQLKRSVETYLPRFFHSSFHKSRLTIFVDLCLLLGRWRCLPFHYFRYGLYRRNVSRLEMANYLPETVFYERILPRLNYNMFLLDDKLLFARIVSSVGIRHPQIACYVQNRTVFAPDGSAIKTKGHFDLCLNVVKEGAIIKPILGSGGKQIKRLWLNRSRLEVDGVVFDFNSSKAILGDGDYIVQQLVDQCAEAARPHPPSVNSLRVMTYFQRGIGARVVFCIMKMGANGALTDNAHTGGIYSRVDLSTGQLDAIAYDEQLREHSIHPNTGIFISSIVVPHIEEVIKMAEQCGNLFPDLTFVGWDIACSKDGPLVLEGNSSPGLTIIQRTYRGMIEQLKPVVDARWIEQLHLSL